MNFDKNKGKSIIDIFNEMEYEQNLDDCNLEASGDSKTNFSFTGDNIDELNQALKITKQPRSFENALQSAIEAQNKWKNSSALKRAHSLHKIWKELTEISKSLSKFKTEFLTVVDYFDFYSDLAIQTEEYKNWRPQGVVFVVLPEYSPHFILGAIVPAALATGCSVIVNVPERLKILPLVLEEIIAEVGLPDGLLTVVSGTVSFPYTQKINKVFCERFFAVGHFCLKGLPMSFSLFCPGNTSALILESCDLNAAVDKIVTETWGKNSFFAVSNIVVQESVHMTFLEKLKDRIEQFLIENVNSPKFNDKVISKKINKVILEAVNAGATVEKCTKYENKIEWSPTIVINYQNQNIHEYVPILKVLLCRTAKEGVTLVNNGPYTLGTSIWTEIPSQALEISNMLDTPNVWINCHGVFEAGEPLQLCRKSGNCVLGGSDGILEFMSFRLDEATIMEENKTYEYKNHNGDKTKELQMVLSAQQAFNIWQNIKNRRKYFKDIANALEDNKELSKISEMISNYAHFGNVFSLSKRNITQDFSVIRNKIPIGVILLIITTANIDIKSIASLITHAIVLGNAVIVILQEDNAAVKLLIKTFNTFLPRNIVNVAVGVNTGIYLASNPNVQAIWLYEESTVSVQFLQTIRIQSLNNTTLIWIVPKNISVSEHLFYKECLRNKIIWMAKVDQFP